MVEIALAVLAGAIVFVAISSWMRMLVPMVGAIGFLIVGGAIGLWIGSGSDALVLGTLGFVLGGILGWAFETLM